MPLEDTHPVFDLPERLRRKATAELIGADERQFEAIRAALAVAEERTRRRLDAVRREHASHGQRALERDLEARQLSARLRVLGRFGLDACIGRMVADDGTVTYLGRFGLADEQEERLLMDWRAPASAPFFAATGADPLGLRSRRRYRWRAGRIVDYWDEVFTAGGAATSPDDQSAFIASLAASRSPKMRDVLATLQADQDAIIRADAHGARVVTGGPGTGKTVVALHRAAYLLYSDARLRQDSGELLFVGPHRPYVDYVDDVLPGLGEDGAVVCAIDELVSARVSRVETDATVRRCKGDGRFVDAVDEAVRLWQRVPRRTVGVDTAWGTVPVTTAEWAELFADAESQPHNVVRRNAWEALLDLLESRIDEEVRGEDRDAGGSRGAGFDDGFDAYGAGWDDDDEPVREALENDDELRALFDEAWPLLDPDALLRGLLSSPEMLRRCAGWLTDTDIRAVVAAGAGFTDVDLPLLDAARLAVGDPRAETDDRRAAQEAAEARRAMSDVVTDLIASDGGDLRIMSMLRGQDLRRTLVETRTPGTDPYVGPFAHLIVDEAQELTDAQWRMLLRRCPSGSVTIVGDRAQARGAFAESWTERLERVGLRRIEVSTLTVNYRTPAEVMDAAAPVIRAVLPDADVPTSVRRTGSPVAYARRADLAAIVDDWERVTVEGTAVVIGDPSFPRRERVASLDAVSVKGLEFDLVVIVSEGIAGGGFTEAVDRYVAMTRATQQLVILEG